MTKEESDWAITELWFDVLKERFLDMVGTECDRINRHIEKHGYIGDGDERIYFVTGRGTKD